MLVGGNIGNRHLVADFQVRQPALVRVGARGGVGNRIRIGAQEPGERDRAARRGELHILVTDRNFHGHALHIRHLRCDRALPNQFVQLIFLRIQLRPELRRGGKLFPGRADSLVGLLRILHLTVVAARRIRHMILAKQSDRLLPGGLQALLRQGCGVGTHIGDVPVFVQSLRHPHGALRRVVQLPARLLLQR